MPPSPSTYSPLWIRERAIVSFERQVGELLDLDIEAGEPKTFWTAIGKVDTYGHLLRLEVFEIHVEAMVYFFSDAGVHKNLLGRRGWLDRVRFGLVEHDHVLYLAPYDL